MYYIVYRLCSDGDEFPIGIFESGKEVANFLGKGIDSVKRWSAKVYIVDGVKYTVHAYRDCPKTCVCLNEEDFCYKMERRR